MNRGEEASVSGSADDELQTASTSQSINEQQQQQQQQPKKGILKRSSLNDEKRDKPFPMTGFRSSPDRFPERGSTRIPKLQVTWWEKNAVAFIGETSDENNTDSEQIMRDLGNGRRDESSNLLHIRQTAILDSEDSDINESELKSQLQVLPDLDDAISVTSSAGSATSSVVGRWWTSKDTRYIPHCQKKGCNHANHITTSEYITPTQRRNKELASLKKELRQAISERDEKEKHLSDLRDKVKEIEIYHETQSTLIEGQKMMYKEQMEKDALEKDLKIMEKKHAVRVNQLIQETMAAREELVRMTSRNSLLEALINVAKVDIETQTEKETNESDFLLRLNSPNQFDPQIVSNAVQTELNTTISTATTPVPSDRMQSPGPSSNLISMVSPDPNSHTLLCSQEVLNHIQACQNEAFIWRTKAAGLEIVAKDQIMKIEQLEHQLEKLRSDLKNQKVPIQTQVTVTKDALIIEDRSNLEHREDETDLLVTNCNFEACQESKNVMKNEIENLRQTFNDAKKRISELEDDINVFRSDLEKADDERMRLEELLRDANLDIESKTAEIVASLNTANRLQQEKESMHQAIDYMEGRMQVYRNTLQDNDLVVTDEISNEWRKTITDPSYMVMNCKMVQTTLTSQQLSEHESEFLNAQKTLAELKEEFTAKNSTLADRFREVENILLAKSDLVEALSKQLEDARKVESREIEEKQNERNHYKKSLEKIASIAEKVPILETKLASVCKEKNEIEAQLKKHMEEREDEMADILEKSLNKNKSQAEYWNEKLRAHEAVVIKLKSENDLLRKDLEDQKMKSHLHNSDLQKRLLSSIEHVEKLQEKASKSQRDVECQAIPRQINKYVGCKPNVKHKETMIVKGTLFDENEERLRICKSELETTRRQVTVLQQKLVSVIQQQTNQKVKKRIAVLEDNSKNKLDEESLEKKVRELEFKNAEQMERINTLETEKFVSSTHEKSRIQKLVNEFDNLRQKLDLDMSNYSKEKQWLQKRISNLENDNSELQKLINQKNIQESDEDSIAPRKAMSEPDFTDLVSTEEDRNIRYKSQRINDGYVKKSNSLSSSQPFSHLADVLNLVRSDLEQVLTEIDESDNGKGEDQQHSDPINISSSTDILSNVLSEWAEDERKMLERQLKRSQEERAVFKYKNEELTKNLQMALAELNVYRFEKPRAEKAVFFERSLSFGEYNENHVGNDVQRWKDKSGTLFREVNKIREDLKIALEKNNELRYQLALAKGERELSNCLERDCPISPSLSFHTAPDATTSKEKDKIVVYEPNEPFQFGSSKASLSCNIIIRSQSLDWRSQRIDRARRSQSANRKPPASREELYKREKRRELRIPKDVSRSSSVTSLYISAKDQPKLPVMSSSWHEKASELMDGDTDNDKRNIRVISLREKVGKLSRENKELQAKLQYFNTADREPSRILELEKETQELKSKIKMLLQKVSNSSPNCRQLELLQDELEIRRQESAMYEKKISDIEEERKEMYLLMFKKGQQAANMEMKEEKIMDSITEDRVTLKFLHDAFYYYLLNRGDSQEHLQVMMTILGFTNAQKSEIFNSKRGRSK